MKRFLEADPHFPKDLPNGEIRAQTLIRLMDKTLYAGYLESAFHNVSLRKARHEGLITLETFEKIQKRRRDNGCLPARKDIHKDFVLRGAICCHDCKRPLRSGWSKGKTKQYAYYLCQTKDCAEYGKSIARATLESEFETLLQGMQPSKTVFNILKDMFKDAWETQTAKTADSLKAFKEEARKAEKEIGDLIKRVMEATSPRVVQAYESRIDELEKRKLILEEKASRTHVPRHSFEKILELSMLFLANPCKLWALGPFEVKRTVLKLAFAGPIYYDRNEGARTPLKAPSRKAFMPFLGGTLQDGAPKRSIIEPFV
jgi:site-specific DNA recombinase